MTVHGGGVGGGGGRVQCRGLLALPRVGLDSAVLVPVASVQHVLVFNH